MGKNVQSKSPRQEHNTSTRRVEPEANRDANGIASARREENKYARNGWASNEARLETDITPKMYINIQPRSSNNSCT